MSESAPREAATFESPAVRFVRLGLARRLAWAAAACFFLNVPVLGLVTSVGHATGWRWLGSLASSLAPLAFLAAPVLLLGALVARRVAPSRAAAVAVEAGALTIRGVRIDRRVPLADVVDGVLAPARAGEVLEARPCADLGLRSGTRLRVELPIAEARRLLAAVGVDVTRRAARFQLGDTGFLDVLGAFVGFAAGMLGFFFLVTLFTAVGVAGRGPEIAFAQTAAGWALVVGGMLLGVGGLRALFGPATVVVGADGVQVTRLLRRARFVPYADLVGVEAHPDRLVLVTERGVVRARARNLDAEARERVRARVEEAHDAHRAAQADPDLPHRLARRGRSVAEWRAAALALSGADPRYRVAPVSRDAVASVLGSAASPVASRLGAAFVLAEGSAEERARVAEAARAAAHPRLRIALASIAEGKPDEAAIEALAVEEERAAAGPARRA